MPNIGGTTAWGLTTAAHPTFWFYVPGRASVEVPIEFVLQDPTDEYIYKTVLTPLDTSPGILGVELPQNTPSLLPKVLYSWTLSMGCNSVQRSEVTFVRGYIQRQWPIDNGLNDGLRNGFTERSALDKAMIYAKQGFWYDAITTIAKARQMQPSNEQITLGWQDLLSQGGLTELQTAKLKICCNHEGSAWISSKSFNAKD
jgi:hypothetical protein